MDPTDPDPQHCKEQCKKETEGRIKKWTTQGLKIVVWVIQGTETCNFQNNRKRNSFVIKMNTFYVLGIRKKKKI